MAAFKQFLTSDVIVNPFEVNKGFTFLGGNFTTCLYDIGIYDDCVYDLNVTASAAAGGEVYIIDRFLGTSGSFETNKTLTGNLGTQYEVLIFDSIKELYYSNYQSSPTGFFIYTQSLIPGDTPEGDVFVGGTNSEGRYYNYLPATTDIYRYLPTGSGAQISVWSIASRVFGDYIQPNSVRIEVANNSGSYIFLDDGNGNLTYSGNKIGNVIYQHGLIIFTKVYDNPNLPTPPETYGSGSYGEDIYGGGLSAFQLTHLTNVTCSFSSSYTIYETQYKATLRESEFNFSQNPSIISSSTDGSLYDFATDSYFSPYVTTVGLYDEQQNLLAVGKLSQPLPTSRTTDTNIFINIDR